ncbi:MAG: hypothetical protein VX546_11545 [Myxococcota bacterium]|nr:hypothetical protein [Myxococcota bacterium]
MAADAWRLLRDGEAPGAWNMGVDEALLTTAAAGGPPTVRFYGWEGFWLSLGYAQRAIPEQVAACRAAGAGVVRRATGGRAVLHGRDLTYAVAAPASLLPQGLRETYGLLAEAVAAGLARLGVATERAPARAGAEGDFDCFAVPAGDELCVGGLKLVGSAQLRAGGAVLQHGSLRLAADPAPMRRAAGLGGGGATSLAELGCSAAREEVQEALGRGFEGVLGAALRPGPLTPAERQQAGQRGLEPAPRARAADDEGAQGASRVADT